jgi:hypothetical protein
MMALLMALAVLPAQAFAAVTLPSADILADIALVVAFITAIGGAIVGLHYVAKAFGWAKKV